MLLLTGATGLVGANLLPALLRGGEPVRCLVRDPRRLGPQRVRVQIALGDLADPQSFRNALRGVSTVVHLAGTVRDQRSGSIEELNGVATWRMVTAAERAGVERFVFFSVLGASTHHRTRLSRAKALAEQAVRESSLRTTVFAPSLVYAPGDRWLTMLERMALAPAMVIPGDGEARFQPMWVSDAVECVMAALTRGEADASHAPAHVRYELAGPEALTHTEMVALVLRSLNRRRRLVHVPEPLAAVLLRAGERVLRSRTFATWDEAELLQASLVTARGTADAQALGVRPLAMGDVLGSGG